MKTNVKVTGVKKTFEDAYEQLMRETAQKLGLEVVYIRQALEDATPKDTGFASKSWYEVRNPDGTYTIQNWAPYIEDLNNGHSRQAPEHFIEHVIFRHPSTSANGVIVKSS